MFHIGMPPFRLFLSGISQSAAVANCHRQKRWQLAIIAILSLIWNIFNGPKYLRLEKMATASVILHNYNDGTCRYD